MGVQMVLGTHRLPASPSPSPAAKVTASFGRKDQDFLSCESLIDPAPRSDGSAVTQIPVRAVPAACREHGDFKACAPCEAPPARRPPAACRAGGSVCGGPATKQVLISRAGTRDGRAEPPPRTAAGLRVALWGHLRPGEEHRK